LAAAAAPTQIGDDTGRNRHWQRVSDKFWPLMILLAFSVTFHQHSFMAKFPAFLSASQVATKFSGFFALISSSLFHFWSAISTFSYFYDSGFLLYCPKFTATF
jgi:hypothetical protein